MEYPGSLHGHSEYSNLRLRDSINKLSDLMWYAAELGHEVFALTDHETIAGYIKAEEIYKKIKSKYPDFKLIRGNEIYLCRNELNSSNFESGDSYYHFVLLAKDEIGSKQIRQLSTRAWNRSYMHKGMRRVPTYYSDIEEIIGGDPGHVIGSTACRGSALGVQLMRRKSFIDTLNRDSADGLYQEIKNWCKYLQEVFGVDNFYLELQPSADNEQKYINQEILKLSKELNIEYIITCDEHYKSKDKAQIHEAFLKSQDGEREVSSFYATTYLMNTDELENYLAYMTREELDQAYKTILKIKNNCTDYTLFRPLKIPQLKWKAPIIAEIPEYYINYMPTLKTFIESSFEGDKILAKIIIERVISDKTLQTPETYAEIEAELQITWKSSEINNTHWSSYFLNLQKIIDICWDAGTIVGPGRGSGVGFLLLYILDITQINPLRETTRTFNWRFLNPDRVSVLDVDFDISGLKRKEVLEAFRREYGEDRVANVATFGKETSKAAILTAARGLGIEVDEAQYLSSLVPSDRGQIRTLSQCYYGDVENDFKPIPDFVRAMADKYPEVWEVAKEIEGLISKYGIHAGGVIFVDEPFEESTALMKAPDGTTITQFDLHDAEKASLIKYDALSVEAMDRIQICIELLQKHNYVDPNLSLREAYEKTIGIYNLERKSPFMWQMIWEHKILSLFQMEQQSGIQGIALTKPASVDDLAVLNSVIRLMAQEKGGEQPLDKYARFKNDKSLWHKEMRTHGLSNDEMALLEPVVGLSNGICESQEKFMELVQLPECGGFSLTWADSLRKAIAKKDPAGYLKLEEEYFRVTEEKQCSKPLCNYVWRVLIAMSRGYGFNASHTLAYSLVGLQEMNLAFKFPIIFWNCANLIVDSGGTEEIGEDKGTDYTKMAIALNKTLKSDIQISLVDINQSDYSFKPDTKNNQILFGMKALSGVNNEVIDKIIRNRPYANFSDFMTRCPLNKTVMFSLIKAGAFDKLEQDWARELNVDARTLVMVYYISRVCEPKSKLTLQNFNGLIQRNLIPSSLEQQRRVFIFNKYLKDNMKRGTYYLFDEACMKFYSSFYDMNKIEVINGQTCILQKSWDKIYQDEMDAARDWLKDNQTEVLKELNWQLFKECWDKYAKGNISAWEMESLCFYYHDHELKHINLAKYGIDNFFDMPEEPAVDYFFKRNGKEIPVYKTYKIIGTVIGKNDIRSSISLLTTEGVVNVKFTKEYFAEYNRQISEVQADGTKHRLEEGWFKRGTKVMVTGFRRDDTFVGKTYAKTLTHQLYKITELDNNGNMTLVHDRYKAAEAE